MTAALQPHRIFDRDGKVVISMQDKDGNGYEMPLTIFEVSTLVSGLYTARGEAMKQPPPIGPEVMLSITAISFGSDEEHEFLRIETGKGYHQDYAVEKGTNLAKLLEVFSAAAASNLGQEPIPFDPGGGQMH